MASQIADSTSQKPRTRQKVRIVGKIRPFTDSEIDSSQGLPAARIVVQKLDSSDHVALLVGDQTSSQKEPYKFDYCYEQDEDTEKIYSQEVKPLISEIFQGSNVAVLAYGACASGKTHIIQGSNGKPGLASLALAEILSKGKKIGSSVLVSFYEIYQDRIYDLLKPKQEVFVLENNGGKIQLRGLSQVPVNSLSDFNILYSGEHNQQKAAEKHLNDTRHRTHKGLTIQISGANNDSKITALGKMMLIDLAGYEDTKRMPNSNPYLAESTKFNNKSLYALQNVIYALNAKEKRVPFREAKLTRILQDSMEGNNKTLMITCVNPTLGPDTIHSISVSSRLCQATKANRTSTVEGSHTLSAKKTPRAKFLLVDKKTNYAPSAEKGGRKLFGTANHTPKCTRKQETPSVASSEPVQETTSTVPSCDQMQKKCFAISNKVALEHVPEKEECSLHISLPLDTSMTAEVNQNSLQEEITFSSSKAIESLTPQLEYILPLAHHVDSKNIGGPPKLSDVSPGFVVSNENKYSPFSRPSPPISARLREITNTLKSLSSTPVPLCVKTPIAGNICYSQVSREPIEPSTPSITLNLDAEDATAATPREVYETRSCGLKKSMVKEYLKYLNTASKEELKSLNGVGEKRANYILELREESPEPFKELDDLKEVGLSAKQVNRMMRKAAEALFI
ncbi:hypothetical protein H6P81_017137 [Aristolochia fimbriata]|uniref:Kinesin motor domain-containing protein n=1 Tax=Aristolochia fimbriata TaxID=158543 RepID=A0AAV7DYC9_ARIFI|nr:hypothetical protein H6P81_017137 [Aristolochia fimbriata]